MGLFSSVGHLVGGLTGAGGAHAAKDAAAAQEEALRKAIAEQNSGYAGQQTLFNPYAQMGTQGLEHLNALNSGDFSAFQNSPDYLYALKQGLGAVNANAGAMGNLFSGSRATALDERAQGLATQNLGNYRNALGQQIGIGQYGTSGLSNALTNKTNSISDMLTGIGNARAGGQIGASNAWGQGASNLVNLATSIGTGGMSNMLGGLFKSAGASGYGLTQQGSMSPTGTLTSNSGYNPYYPH